MESLQRQFRLDGQQRDFFFLEGYQFNSLPKEPYRTETFGIGFYRKGKIRLTTGLITHEVQGPVVISMGPSVIRQWHEIENTVQCSLLFFTESFYVRNNANIFALNSFEFFEKNDCHVLKLNNELLATMESIFSQIRRAVTTKHRHEAEVVRSYATILINEMDAARKGLPKLPDRKSDPSHVTVSKFKTLLAEEFIRQRSVSFYADKLHLSPKHFSSVIKAQTGKSAGEWIDEMVLLEAKVLLQNKSLSIAQIADILHFTDQSTFGKFFKTNQGRSPLDYRKSLN